MSYHNTRGLHKLVDQVPPRAQWKTQEIWFKDGPDDKHVIHYRDPLEAVRTLLGNPAHASDIVYKPQRIFSDASKSTRIYNEMWTGEWWNSIQVSLYGHIRSTC